jgi:hypothetical protein
MEIIADGSQALMLVSMHKINQQIFKIILSEYFWFIFFKCFIS